MSCVIKYKGQSIPEEQFLQYLNKQIAINNLFNENETLANDVYEALGFTGNISDEQKQQKEADIGTGKIPNTEYEVRVDGVYFEGKKLNNPKNLSHKELITEDIRRRNEEELNRVDKQNGERLDSKDAELRNKREAATRVLNGKDSKSYLESEQAQQDYDILGGLIYEGIVSERTDSDYIKRAYTPYSEKVNAKYDAELESLNNQITPQQKQQALQLYSQYLDSLNKPNTNPILQSNQNPDVILPIGTSGSGKSTFIKSLPQENLVVIEPDAMRIEFTGDMNNKSKDKEIYEEAARRAIKAIKQGKQVVFDTTNLTKDKRLPFIEAIKKEIPNANIQYKLMELNPELAKQRIKAQLERGENRAAVSDETIDRHAESYKQMLEDIKNEPVTEYKELGSKQDIEGIKGFISNKNNTSEENIKPGVAELFESNPELANVGTPQQYSQYLDSLNKPNTNPILQTNQEEQVKKFAELQERLNNKKFLEGAKNAYENSEELKSFGTQEEYNDYIARVSLGIIKNPSSGDYNYTSKVKDIVYHGTNRKFEQFNKDFLASRDAYKNASSLGFYFTTSKSLAEKYLPKIDTDPFGLGEKIIDVENATMINALLNIKNPIEIDEETFGNIQSDINKQEFQKDVDALSIDNYTFSVFEPEQIHILGSKQDVEGFKDFVHSKPTSVKPGVEELFESNPKLANSVYETLGFETNIIQDNKSYYRGQLKPFKIGRNGNLILEPQYAGWQEEISYDKHKGMGISMSPDLSVANAQGNMFYEGNVNRPQDEGWMDERDAEDWTTNAQNEGYYVLQVDKAYVTENFKDIFDNENYEQRIGATEPIIIPKGKFKIENITPDVDTQISPEQKQQAQQIYSQYLDTLTDEPIVYKGFRNKAGIVHNTPNHSYFTNSFKIANAWYKNEKGIKTFVIPKVRTEFFKADTSKGVSTIKPQEENFINSSKAGLIKLETNDIGGWQIQHVVNKSINMLELGSKQDIDGFSRFVSSDYFEASERRKETINPPKEIAIIKTLKANLSFADRQKCN